MRDLSTSAAPLPKALADDALPTAIVRSITSLDPLPATAQRLVALLNTGAEVSGAQLADLFEDDAATTATVLRHASTARFAGGAPSSVREAILRLGVTGVLDLVLDGHLERLRTANPLYDLSEDEQWRHGAAARLAAAALRRECRRVEIPPIAETAALLHDIGKLVVARYLKANVQALVAYARDHATTFVAAERALLGTDHAAVGGAMARHWHFPSAIAVAIAAHHTPEAEPPSLVLDAVVVANVVAKSIGAGLGAEGTNFAADPAAFDRLGLDFPAFGRVCLATEAALRDLAAVRATASGPQRYPRPVDVHDRKDRGTP